ncbi:50S ribosomal protein L23 [Rickettsiales endosymbiont of Peranema trichophorum]|uniref:50S ribosomal protein L23 n=1 Tax=Rickettsiales endosymbiont of Peranema trichophorum TaxID=2486577 RepID=UPI001022AFF4|nr:50S ribosomal protein L23 [Rickettsiales endosymbiont of Peranema trichophorum]
MQDKLFDVLLHPIQTEKATKLSAFSKYVFKVKADASKSAVSSAVEKIFNVKVVKVNIVRLKPKLKRFKGIVGQRQGYKKAIVSLESGKVLDLGLGS